MPRNKGPVYTLMFAAAVCTVCGVLVSSFAVGLKSLQDENKRIDKQRNVLLAAGLIGDDQVLDAKEISNLFSTSVKPEIIALKTGKPTTAIDAMSYDQRLAATDPKSSVSAPPNKAKVGRLPKHALLYKIVKEDTVDMLVFPVEGKGLWSTLYGFLALDGQDPKVVRGIAFYEHAETPGLGGEVENPKWRARWIGRQVFNERFDPILTVLKGPAGPPAE